jgi:hypothetical protein|nr:MAG TPA: tail-collar fiber protein [Caudoviricetes sp.]
MADKWTNCVITNAGLSMLGEVMSGGELIISRAALGGGNVEAAALMAQTALTQPLSVPAIIAKKKLVEGKGLNIRIQIRNTDVSTTQVMKQVGLFAKIGSDGEEKLFAIMQDDIGEDIPSNESYPDFMLEFTAAIAVSNTGEITVNISGDAVITADDLKEALEDYTTKEKFDAEIKKLQSSGESKADKTYVDKQLEGKADKSDIPSSLPANGGNADTVGGHPPSDFVLSTREGIEAQTQIPNNVDIPAWISQNAMAYKRYYTNSENTGLTNLPTADTSDWVWYYFDGINIIARSNLTNNVWITANINCEFRGWTQLNATKLPADGGNADTLGNIAPSGFLLAAASRKLTTSLNASGLIGTYYCEDRFTPDYPKDSSGNAYGQYGLLDVRIYGSIFYQTMMFENGIVIHRAKIAGATEWSSWQKLNDGGNAATVNGHSVNSDVPANAKFTDTTYSPGTGISISGTTISNSGVRSVATGGSNGTISVNTNGTAANVAVKGLASAAYQAVQTAAGTVGLHRISSGTAAATTTNCPAGCWYGKHD